MEADKIKPFRLRGGRFDAASAETLDVGFPLAALSELVRYQRLIVEVARGLWKDDNPGRQRAPKGFELELNLRLTAVERGSVAPVLERQRVPETEPSLFPESDGWLQRSQSQITEAIGAITSKHALPESFPDSARPLLVQFGSSLRADEAFLFDGPAGQVISYTQEARSFLREIVAADDVTIDGELVGQFIEFHAENQTFQFRDRDSQVVAGSFAHKTLLGTIKAATGKLVDAPFVRVSCSYTVDDKGCLSRIEDVETLETIVSSEDRLARGLRELLELEAGWMDGDGTQVTAEAVEWVRDFASQVSREALALAALSATLEGGVLLERQVDQRRWSLEVEPDGEAWVMFAAPGEKPRAALMNIQEAVASFEGEVS